MSNQLYGLYKTGFYADATIQVGETSFLVHRKVLGARSSYFKALLEGQMAESRQDVVLLKDTEAKPFEVLLVTLYEAGWSLVLMSSWFSEKELRSMLHMLLEGSARYDVYPAELCHLTITNFCMLVTVHNVIEVIKVSRRLGLEELVEKCQEFIVKNHCTVGKAMQDTRTNRSELYAALNDVYEEYTVVGKRKR